MAEERSNGTPPVRGVNPKNTVDIQHRLPAPDNIEETSVEIAAPVKTIKQSSEIVAPVFSEETSAEIAAPIMVNRNHQKTDNQTGEATMGRGMGFLALAISIISLFVLPILFGAAGIILGFVARRRGAVSLGNWAIGIGAIAIIVGIFILPFF